MMILLEPHSLTAKNRFQPEKMSVQLSERTSTATMTLGPSAPTLSVGDWLQSEKKPIKNIVWRVKTIDTQYDTNTRTVTIEHIIASLKDTIMFGEVTAATITGNKNATKCQASEAARYIINRSADWKLGNMSRNSTQAFNFNGDDLYSALETVGSTLTECVWEYSFSKYPFTIHLHAMSNDTGSEMRLSRNIKTLRKTIDRSRMYTRHYPIGKDDLHIGGNYVSRNESLYGTICKTETDQSKTTAEELKAWAEERLNRHCQPSVTVTISGLDLSEATGEPLDSFTLGRICRVPLPEFSTTINERVSKLNYADVINEPMNVTVTLANEVPDIASIVKQETQETSKASRTHAKNGKDDHAWMVDTDDHIGLIAEAIVGPDANWSRVASVIVDGEGIHQRVTKTENGLVTAQTSIEATEKSITLEAKARSDKDSELEGKITVEAGKINLVVGQNADGSHYIRGGRICLAINDAGSTAVIEANHVKLLGGDVKLNDVLYVASNHATFGEDVYMKSGCFMRAGRYIVSQGGEVDFFNSASSGIALKYEHVNTMIIKANVDGDTLQLWKRGDNPSGDPSITFRKAAAPSITLAWNSSNDSVKATASGATTKYYHVTTAFYHPSSNYYIALFHTDPDTGSTNYLTGSSHRIALKREGTTVKIVDPSNDDAQYSQSPTYTIPLKAEEFNANGDYDPPTGYAGFSSVKVSVQDKYSHDRTFTCTGKQFTNNTWKYTFSYTINNSSLWDVDGSYTFGTNQ